MLKPSHFCGVSRVNHFQSWVLRLSRSKQLPWRKVDGPMWTIGSGRVVEADVLTRPTFALLLAHSCSTTCFTFALLSAYFCTTFVLIFLFFLCLRVYELIQLVYFGYKARSVCGFQLYFLCSCRYKLNIGCIISHILDNGCWEGFGSWCTVTLTHPSSGTMSRRAKTHLIMTILGGDSPSKTDTICLLLFFYSENIVSVCVCLSVIGGLEGWGV